MPEDLKINVGVGGAKQAAADLQGVASAEHSVAAATSGGADKMAASQKGAAETASELHMRNSTLLRSVAMLGPEFSLAAGALNEIINKTTSAGMALGLLGVAIGAASYAISKYNESQAEQKRKAEEVLAALERQRQAYLGIVDAAEKAANAARPRGKGSEELAKQVMGVAAEPGMGTGKDVTQDAINAFAAAGIKPTDEDVANFLQWLALGKAPRGVKTDLGRYRTFASASKTSGFQKGLKSAWEQHRKEFPALTGQREQESQLAMAGVSPAADAAEVYRQVAEQETAAGRPITPEEAKAVVEEGLFAMKSQTSPIESVRYQPGPMLKRIAQARALIGHYKSISDLRPGGVAVHGWFDPKESIETEGGGAGTGQSVGDLVKSLIEQAQTIQIHNHYHGPVNNNSGNQFGGPDVDPSGIVQPSSMR